MNRKVIQKLLEELDKESPRLDYIRGVLETVLENLPNGVTESLDKSLNKMFESQPMPLSESEILDKEARARLKNIKDIAI